MVAGALFKSRGKAPLGHHGIMKTQAYTQQGAYERRHSYITR